MPDGYIDFSVRLDAKEAEGELSKIKKKIHDLEMTLAEQKGERSALEEKIQKAGDAAERAQAKLEAMKRAGASATDIKAQESIFQGYAKESDAAVAALAKQDNKIAETTRKIDLQKTAYAQLQQEALAAGDSGAKAAGAVEKRLDAVKARAAALIKRIGTLAASALVFSALSRGFTQLREFAGQALQTNEEFVAATARLKGALLSAFTPIYTAILPALTALINFLATAISYVVSFISVLIGGTAEGAADAAEALYDEADALDKVGGGAGKASKQLAKFDEINKLTESKGGGGAAKAAANLFDSMRELAMSDWVNDLLGSLRLSFKDVFLDWGDLSGEQIAEKIIAGLAGLAGAVIGFSIGGVPGAIVGAFAGVALGLIFDSLIFDHDGVLSRREVISLVCIAAGALVGGVLGFIAGGPLGAAIGVLVGAGLGLAIDQITFDNDGVLSRNEVLTLVCVAAGALVGGVLGFSIGGPLGAAIGVTVGAGLGLVIDYLLFKPGDTDTKQMILSSLILVAGALAGGALGFALGGPLGAVLGVTVGAGLSLLLKNAIFSNDGSSYKQLVTTLLYVLLALGGGLVGFALGGPVGAVFGVAVGVGLTMLLESTVFSGGGKELYQKMMDTLLVVLAAVTGGLIGFFLGGPAGAVIGATIGVGVTLAAKSIQWDSASQNAIETFAHDTGKFTSSSGSFSTSTKSLKLPTAKLPRLAQGAVIPANREFLAVLGDQRSGTNIETPLDTMVQAFRQALREGGGGQRTVVLQLDGGELGRIMFDLYSAESTRVGTQIGGFA